ncbi:MAG: class I mannose-6-phosphate isomerase [Firmicutes bacterium]|nr:class I mannose-6-phosphate isomerase [Bacillota bacterium]MDD4337294.1 class I mannose-6-phosphate isomerase [Bacillota bacterium]
MSQLYPLSFISLFKEKVWGGRRLESWFPEIPDGPIGEAWVLSAHPHGITPVENGPLAGQTIPELVAEHRDSLIGAAGSQNDSLNPAKPSEFPILIKLLNSNDDLSVQVHPGQEYAASHPEASAKSEMWLVLEADPGSTIVHGLREGVTPQKFREAAMRGAVMDCLNRVEVSAGDVVSIPPGTIHALGAGLVVAEVQQSSDTVYRVWDYDRPGLDGQPRELHIDQALEVADYSRPPEIAQPQMAQANSGITIGSFAGFDVGLSRCCGRWERHPSPHSFTAFLFLGGTGEVAWGEDERTHVSVRPGSSILIPASCPDYVLRSESGDLVFMEVSRAL